MGTSILVVSSSPSEAEALQGILVKGGMEPFIAQTPAKALQRLKSQRFDAALVDSALTNPTAEMFLAKARQVRPSTLRLVHETAPWDRDGRELINLCAPSGILPKTFTARELLAIVIMNRSNSDSRKAASDMKVLRFQSQVARLEQENKRLKHQVLGLLEQFRLLGADMNEWETIREAEDKTPIPADEIQAEIERRMDTSDVFLPVMPPLAYEIRQMLTSEDCPFDKVASKIALEQGMSARILQVANSPAYGGISQIRNIEQAVSRLGMNETCNIVQAVCSEHLFQTKSQSLANVMARLWVHSLCCAYSNQAIAQILEEKDRGDFFMLGLLHDVGKLAGLCLIEQALEEEVWGIENLTEREIIQALGAVHRNLGKSLLRKWKYPETFVEVVRFHNAEDISGCSEPTIVTYFSNLIARRLGYSLVSDTPPADTETRMAEALNISRGDQAILVKKLEMTVQRISKAYTRRSNRVAAGVQ